MNPIILIGDLHFGDKSDNEQHNKDLLEFLDFVAEFGKEHSIRRLSMLGDYFDRRSTTGVLTNFYATAGVEELRSQFDDILFIPGNHDLFYRDSRGVTSLEGFKDMVELVRDVPIHKPAENSLYCPWVLTPEEYTAFAQESLRIGARFVLGHFEFRSFKMNDSYVMESGQNPAELAHVERVFSSHYHKRQEKGNVTYIGSPFPFDYGDANDPNRGFCVLDTDSGEYTFVNYDRIRIYSIPYQKFMAQDFLPDTDNSTTSIQVVVDSVISAEESAAITTKLESLHLRHHRVSFETNAIKELLAQDSPEIENVQNLDSLVTDYLAKMTEVDTVDRELLKSLYEEAMKSDD